MDEESEVYTVDEALSAVGFGKFQAILLLYAGLGWFADAMEIMILSFIGPALRTHWSLSSAHQSLLTTVVFAGMLLGAPLWGLLSDSYGRRKGLLGIAFLLTIAGFLSSFSPNLPSLLILRFVVGAGLGGGSVFSCWFLEFVPVSNRGKWMVIFSTFWTLGSIFEASLAWIVMPRLNWRWLLALSSLPSFALLLFFSVVPESPRYLCTQDRLADAQLILEKIALLNRAKLPSGRLVSDRTLDFNSIDTPLLISSTQRSSISLLFSSPLIRTTLLLWVLYFGNSFSYYGIILLTSELSAGSSKCQSTPTLLSQNSQDTSLYRDVFITSLAELPGLILSAILVDRIGRKLSMIVTFILACLFLLPLAFQQPATLTTGLLFGARLCTIGTFTVACIYAPELYPTSMRTTGAGVANAMGRIGGMVCPMVAVGLVSGCHQTAAVLLFQLVMLFTALSIFFFQFETKGQQLNDTFASSSSTSSGSTL
ncbi:hypothetical protein UlMin_042352 [Ulmus minor]